jgi:hypothetical protein
MKKFRPEKCAHCNQTTTYLLGLDRGSFLILRKLLAGVIAKGVNEIHPTRDLVYSAKEKWLPSNVARPRKHGLIAFTDKKGYYALTRKAGKLLRGQSIPRYAVISKSENRTLGYFEPEMYQVTARELLRSDEIPYWEGELAQAGSMLDVIDPRDEERAPLSLFKK